MRKFAAVIVVALALGACTSDPDPAPRPSTTSPAEEITVESLDLDWPTELALPEPPSTPEGFDAALLERMASIMEKWAGMTTLDDSVWTSDDAVDQVAEALPATAATTLRMQARDTVSPQLAVANVFADNVTVFGPPQVTAAWMISTADDDAGTPFVRLELQTRAAYEVQVEGGPPRVIGMLRVHGLSAYADTTDDFGVTGGWQEFGASDCTLALDDALLPDSDAAEALADLKTFVGVGNGETLTMPLLDVEDQVDPEFLKRCRAGSI